MHLGGVETGAELLLRVAPERARGVEDLRPPPVVERDVQRDAVVVRRRALRPRIRAETSASGRDQFSVENE
jgi:hypothetical protein